MAWRAEPRSLRILAFLLNLQVGGIAGNAIVAGILMLMQVCVLLYPSRPPVEDLDR